MTIVYFSALVLGRQASDGLTLAGEAVFVAAVFAASASWQLVIAGSGGLLGRLLPGGAAGWSLRWRPACSSWCWPPTWWSDVGRTR